MTRLLIAVCVTVLHPGLRVFSWNIPWYVTLRQGVTTLRGGKFETEILFGVARFPGRKAERHCNLPKPDELEPKW